MFHFQQAALLLALLCLDLVLAQRVQAQSRQDSDAPPLIMAHYMPWYSADETQNRWGWHWTMNHFDPQRERQGRREIASQFYPVIGPYDSQDPLVIEYHLLTMKLAGIDGVIIDWYGREDFRDYAQLHAATMAVIDQADRLQMKYIICYEDQTLGALIENNRLKAQDKVAHATAEIEWLIAEVFSRANYVKRGDRPVLLSFGQNGLSNEEWSQCLTSCSQEIAYLSLHHRRDSAIGAYDWPLPSQGIQATERFANDSRTWDASIPVAFPRFVDIYAQAQLHASYGEIPDDAGNTFEQTFEHALSLKPQILQLATWNDWGEGTQLEPSVEFGYRDLEVLMRHRAQHDGAYRAAEAKDLELPLLLLQARRDGLGTAAQRDSLRAALTRLDWSEARKAASTLKGE